MKSNLGLSVHVTEIMDVERYRETFFFGTVLENAIVSSKDFIRTAADWYKLPPDKRPKSEAEARAIIVNTMRGNMPDDVILRHLGMALSRAEIQIGIPLEPRRIVMPPLDDGAKQGIDYDEVAPRISWRSSTADWWQRIELPNPVISVQRIRAVVGGTVSYTVAENDFEVIDFKGGIIAIHQIRPPAPTDTGYYPRYDVGTRDNLWRSALRMQASPFVPGYWSVDYTTGPMHQGRVGYIPAALQWYVWADAARYIWSESGIQISKGVASQTRSIDGISNTVSLTASAMYGLNSAIEQVIKEYKEGFPISIIRQQMRGLRIRGL